MPLPETVITQTSPLTPDVLAKVLVHLIANQIGDTTKEVDLAIKLLPFLKGEESNVDDILSALHSEE